VYPLGPMNDSLNILIIEEVEDDALRVLKALRKADLRVQWQRVDTAEAFSAALASQPYDLILCDSDLPGFSAVAALDLLKQSAIDIPFIVISGAVSEEIIVDVMRAGANDYVMKSNLTHLPEAVRRELRDAQNRQQREAAEIALQESELRYESLAAAAPVGIFRTNPQGKCIYVNDRWCQMSGLSPAEALGEGWVRAIHPEDREYVFREWDRSVADNVPFKLEYRMQHVEGTVLWLYGQSLPEYNRDGNIIGYVGTATDISDRKRAEQELKKLSRIASQTSEGVIITNVQGYVEWVNDAFTKNTGYTLADLQGHKPGQHLQGPGSDVAVAQQMSEGLKQKRGFAVEILNYTKDRQEFWVDLRCSPLLNEEGEVEGFISIQSNITDKKKTEQQLIQAKEIAEQATRAKSAFLAAMSHEIRTPMNGVMGMLTLLEQTTLTDQQRSQVRIAKSSAEALLNIINDILDFSKVEAGKLELELLDFNLADCLENFAHSIALTLHKDHLELVLDCQGMDSPWVKGDPGRLRQILMNLVGNAVKFTDRGEIVIEANLEPQEDGLRLKVSVSDTGIGIPADRLDSLFESFTQVDVSTTRTHGGTGLGLAICKKLCELMGGEISVESVMNVGSCFSFSIPLQASTRSSLGALERRSKASSLLEDLKVLVVQDNARSRAILQRDLSRWGATVVTVENASQALTQWRHSVDRNFPFDLAIVDLDLLDMSGLEFVRRLHQDPHFQASPFAVLMLLPVNLPPLEEALSDLGIETYLRKPFTPSSLYEVLVNLITTPSGPCQQRPHSLERAVNPPVSPTLNPRLEPLDSRTSGTSVHPSAPSILQPWPLLEQQGQARILLVEDNVINQAVAQGMIEQLGLKVEIATHGEEAIALLAAADQRPYHLVLMDAQMPILDGYETTRRIRKGEAGERHRRVPIIALTAHALMDDRERCLRAGMDDYLSKPLHLQRLATVLQQWLGRSAAENSRERMTSLGRTIPESQSGTTSIENSEVGLALFDSKGLLDRTGGLLDLAQRMVQRFVEGTPSGLQRLQHCLQQRDTTTIARMAHSLQGSTSMIGAEQMQAMLIRIETIACDRDLEALSVWIPKLEEHFQTLQIALMEWIRQNGGR
jgi:two-component system, sensor histidine kinase and response regulator